MKKTILLFAFIGLFISCKRHVEMKDFPYQQGAVYATSTETGMTGRKHMYVWFTVTEKDGKTYEWKVEVPDTIYYRAWHAHFGEIMDIPKCE